MIRTGKSNSILYGTERSFLKNSRRCYVWYLRCSRCMDEMLLLICLLSSTNVGLFHCTSLQQGAYRWLLLANMYARLSLMCCLICPFHFIANVLSYSGMVVCSLVSIILFPHTPMCRRVMHRLRQPFPVILVHRTYLLISISSSFIDEDYNLPYIL